MTLLKKHETRRLAHRAIHFVNKLGRILKAFLGEDGPYQRNIELEQIAEILLVSQRKLEDVTEKGNELNARQTIFKEPITDFKVLR